MEKEQTVEKVSNDIVNLVVARLETIPKGVHVSIGGEGVFSVGELIERVKAQDDVGKKMIEVQLAYLRSLSNLPTQGV